MFKKNAIFHCQCTPTLTSNRSRFRSSKKSYSSSLNKAESYTNLKKKKIFSNSKIKRNSAQIECTRINATYTFCQTKILQSFAQFVCVTY